MVGRVGSLFVAVGGLHFSRAGMQFDTIALPACRCRLLLKLLCRIADNPFVHKSAIVMGLTLALSAATLAGIGGGAADGSSDSATDLVSSSSSVATPGDYAGSQMVAVAPMPANLLPADSYSPASIPGYTISRIVPEVRLEFTVA